MLLFLPPANEVWGKVMFLLESVILSKGGGAVSVRGVSVWRGKMYGEDRAVRILLECFLVCTISLLSLYRMWMWGELPKKEFTRGGLGIFPEEGQPHWRGRGTYYMAQFHRKLQGK